jgi:hypothetical protein
LFDDEHPGNRQDPLPTPRARTGGFEANDATSGSESADAGNNMSGSDRARIGVVDMRRPQ